MKNLKDKVALLDGARLLEMIDELAYVRIMLNEEIIPTARNLEKVNRNLDKTLENFDTVLADKSCEVIEKIDIDFIHKKIIEQVLGKFNPSIKNVDELGILAKKTEEIVQIFHDKYSEIETILDGYEKRILSTKHVTRLLSATLFLLAYGAGALFYPALLFASRHF